MGWCRTSSGLGGIYSGQRTTGCCATAPSKNGVRLRLLEQSRHPGRRLHPRTVKLTMPCDGHCQLDAARHESRQSLPQGKVLFRSPSLQANPNSGSCVAIGDILVPFPVPFPPASASQSRLRLPATESCRACGSRRRRLLSLLTRCFATSPAGPVRQNGACFAWLFCGRCESCPDYCPAISNFGRMQRNG